MSKKKDKIENREDFQTKENYSEVKTGLPEGRFQETAQIATAPETKSTTDLIKGKVAPNQQGTTASAAESVKKKMSIRPSSDASLGDGKQVGGVPLGETAATRGVAGVSRVNVAVDESKIPYTQGGYRPQGRYDKKNSVDNFTINNIICEQVLPEFEESKDLKESPDSTVGYNGRKQFTTARGKKNAGNCPGSLLFDRSVDFVGHSAVIHTTGQVIDNITDRAGYPTKSFPDASDPTGVDLSGASYPGVMRKSNYLLKSFHFTINRNGTISNPYFDEDQYIVDGQDIAIEAANMNWQIDANNVAQTVVKLQTELGRETTDNWSPLGYVIQQPYEYNMLLHDMEATTGAIVGAAYKQATASMAFNQNKMGKDGAKNLAVIGEMFGLAESFDSSYYANTTTDDIFNSNAYRTGSCAAIIEMFDSTGKYTTKADFFNQQRSLKFHLQNVDNNINPLHCKKEFFKALDSEYLFSTEDGNYNPMLPIWYTDHVKLMNPMSLNFFLYNWEDPISGEFDETTNNADTGMYKIYSYSYSDIRNNYSWDVTHPLVAGLMRWMIRHRGNLVKAFFNRTVAANVNSIDVSMPCDFGMQHPSLFAFMVCSAAQDINWVRNVIFRDALFAGEQSSYIWNDLASLKDVNPLYSSQYSYVDYGSPLKLGSMRSDTKVRLYLPEKIEFRRWVEESGVNADCNKYLLPYYYNESALSDTFYQNTGWFNGNTPYVSSMPSIRQGVNHNAVDLLYSMSEQDLILSYDRMTEIPVFTRKGSYNASTFPHAFKSLAGSAYQALVGKGAIADDTAAMMNTAVHFAAMRYDAQSDGRVVMCCGHDDVADNYLGLRNETYYCTPRQFGFIFPLISKYYPAIINTANGNSAKVCSALDHAFLDGGTPSKIVMYRALGQDLNNRSIDRTAALQQNWYAIFSLRDPDIVAHNQAMNNLIGIVPSMNAFIDGADVIDVAHGGGIQLDGALTVFNNQYALHSAQASTTVGETRVVSLMTLMFTLLQRFFTPISLFDDSYDANAADDVDDIPTATPNTDPLEGALYFGFAGCLGSDYNQLVLERLNIKDELNLFYVEDEFIKKSLIFRG